MRGQRIHPWAAGVGQAEQLRDFVEGFAGSVVEGLADVAVVPGVVVLGGEVEVGVSAGDDEGEERVGIREGLLRVHQHGVDVAFEMVHGDQGLLRGEGEGLRKRDADKQCAGEAGAFGDGNGGEIFIRDARAVHGFAHDRRDGAKVFAAGQLGHHAAVVGVDELRGDDV